MPSMSKYLPAVESFAALLMAVINLSAKQNLRGIITIAIAKHMKLTQGVLFRHLSGKAVIRVSVMDSVAKRLPARIGLAVQKAVTAL